MISLLGDGRGDGESLSQAQGHRGVVMGGRRRANSCLVLPDFKGAGAPRGGPLALPRRGYRGPAE